MTKKGIFMWLALGIVMFCIHYGPGQKWLRLDRVSKLNAKAKQLEQSGNWTAARETYEAALDALPAEGYPESRMILRMDRALTYLNTQDVAEATGQLEALLEDTRRGDPPEKELLHDLRASLAHAEYYTAWHMRLENAPREAWRQELEVARQNFRYLGEIHPQTPARRNLEAAIFLARMDIEKLQGLPLPEENSGKGSEGVGDKRGDRKGESQGQGEDEGEGEGEGEGESDSEQPNDARGRGLGRRPDGIGS